MRVDSTSFIRNSCTCWVPGKYQYSLYLIEPNKMALFPQFLSPPMYLFVEVKPPFMLPLDMLPQWPCQFYILVPPPLGYVPLCHGRAKQNVPLPICHLVRSNNFFGLLLLECKTIQFGLHYEKRSLMAWLVVKPVWHRLIEGNFKKNKFQKKSRKSFFWYDNDSGHKGPFPITLPKWSLKASSGGPKVTLIYHCHWIIIAEQFDLGFWYVGRPWPGKRSKVRSMSKVKVKGRSQM